jgi:hypothetical protein
MRTGNSDHERWDNRPSQSEAPKPDPDYIKEKRSWHMARWAVRIGLALVIILGLLLWLRHGKF